MEPLTWYSKLNVVGSGPASSIIATTAPSDTPSSTQSPPAQFTGGSTHVRPKNGLLLMLLVTVSIFIQGSSAYIMPIWEDGLVRRAAPMGPDTERMTKYKLRVRTTSENIRTYAGTFGSYVAGKVGAGGQEYAKGLISGTLSNICQGYFSGTLPQIFAPSVVDGCVSSVYTNDTGLSAEAKFVSIFGASMFCNYVVSQAYPISEQFSGEACQGLQDLVVPSSVSSASQAPTTTQSVPTTQSIFTTLSMFIAQSVPTTQSVLTTQSGLTAQSLPTIQSTMSTQSTISSPPATSTNPPQASSEASSTTPPTPTNPPQASSKTSSTTPQTSTKPTAKSGWTVTFPDSIYYENDISSDLDDANLYLVVNAVKTVNTKCIGGANFKVADTPITVKKGSNYVFETENLPNPDSCCLEYYSNADCTESSGQFKKLCHTVQEPLPIDVASWKVYNCTGIWTGPPQ